MSAFETKIEEFCNIIINEDEFWEARNTAIHNMLSYITHQYESKGSDIFSPDFFRLLKTPVKVMVTDLRSQQVRDICILVSRLAEMAGDKMKIFMRDMLVHILDGLKVPHKLMSGYVDECMLSLIKNVRFRSALVLLINEVKENKAKLMRERCLEYLNEVIVNWEITGKEAENIMEAVKMALEDASLRAREIARIAYMNIFRLYPKKTERVKNSFPKKLQLNLTKIENEYLETHGMLRDESCADAGGESSGGAAGSGGGAGKSVAVMAGVGSGNGHLSASNGSVSSTASTSSTLSAASGSNPPRARTPVAQHSRRGSVQQQQHPQQHHHQLQQQQAVQPPSSQPTRNFSRPLPAVAPSMTTAGAAARGEEGGVGVGKGGEGKGADAVGGGLIRSHAHARQPSSAALLEVQTEDAACVIQKGIRASLARRLSSSRNPFEHLAAGDYDKDELLMSIADSLNFATGNTRNLASNSMNNALPTPTAAAVSHVGTALPIAASDPATTATTIHNNNNINNNSDNIHTIHSTTAGAGTHASAASVRSGAGRRKSNVANSRSPPLTPDKRLAMQTGRRSPVTSSSAAATGTGTSTGTITGTGASASGSAGTNNASGIGGKAENPYGRKALLARSKSAYAAKKDHFVAGEQGSSSSTADTQDALAAAAAAASGALSGGGGGAGARTRGSPTNSGMRRASVTAPSTPVASSSSSSSSSSPSGSFCVAGGSSTTVKPLAQFRSKSVMIPGSGSGSASASRDSAEAVAERLFAGRKHAAKGANSARATTTTTVPAAGSGALSRTEAYPADLALHMVVFVKERDNQPKIRGVVRYIGHTSFANGIWIGVALAAPVGKNNGSVQGQYYFTCAPKHGLFVREDGIERIADSNTTDEPVEDSKYQNFGSSSSSYGTVMDDSSASVSVATKSANSSTNSLLDGSENGASPSVVAQKAAEIAKALLNAEDEEEQEKEGEEKEEEEEEEEVQILRDVDSVEAALSEEIVAPPRNNTTNNDKNNDNNSGSTAQRKPSNLRIAVQQMGVEEIDRGFEAVLSAATPTMRRSKATQMLKLKLSQAMELLNEQLETVRILEQAEAGTDTAVNHATEGESSSSNDTNISELGGKTTGEGVRMKEAAETVATEDTEVKEEESERLDEIVRDVAEITRREIELLESFARSWGKLNRVVSRNRVSY